MVTMPESLTGSWLHPGWPQRLSDDPVYLVWGIEAKLCLYRKHNHICNSSNTCPFIHFIYFHKVSGKLYDKKAETTSWRKPSLNSNLPTQLLCVKALLIWLNPLLEYIMNATQGTTKDGMQCKGSKVNNLVYLNHKQAILSITLGDVPRQASTRRKWAPARLKKQLPKVVHD